MRKILLCFLCTLLCLCLPVKAAQPRARDLGIPFDGETGKWNAITDVAGVEVGYQTLIRDLPKQTAVRTGVTAILPRGKSATQPVMAAIFSLNGNGEMTGSHWVEESGFLEGPVMITNTHSVGVIRDAVIAWRIKQGRPDASGYWWSLPVVAETWDGYLNDINGFHVRDVDAFGALDNAKSGAIAEGSVGGGTGMVCHEFKCGTGSSSRLLSIGDQRFTVGVLVQANYGVRDELRVAGVPVGRAMPNKARKKAAGDTGSIIIVVATDAPLMPHQLKRLSKRAAMGLARNGSFAGDGSGDIFIAFSTANAESGQTELKNLSALPNAEMDPLFIATVRATEEAIVNALVAGRDMVGHDGHKVEAINHSELRRLLAENGRLNQK